MVRSQNPNLEILSFAVEQLSELVDEMVFLGGCATGILITDPAASPIRVTKDVDAIVQVVSHADYYKFSARLRAHGFKEDFIAVLDGRPEIVTEINRSDSGLSTELSKRFKILLAETRFIDAVSGHMPPDDTSQARVSIVIDMLKEIANKQ